MQSIATSSKSQLSLKWYSEILRLGDSQFLSLEVISIHHPSPPASYLIPSASVDSPFFLEGVKATRVFFNWSRVDLLCCVRLRCTAKYSVTCWRKESESHSVMSDSLHSHELYIPWNSPGLDTGVDSLSFFRGSSQPVYQTQVSCITGRFFPSWAPSEAQEY